MRSRRLLLALIALVVLATGGGAYALSATGSSASGKPFHGAAVPPLYTDAQLTAVHAPLLAAEARGHRLAKVWLDAHPVTDDAAFSAWAVGAIGPPPGAGTQAAELRQLKAIAARRTTVEAGSAAWVESHGKKQPWKLFLKQDKPFVAASTAAAAKTALSAGLDLAGRLQLAAKSRYARPSPYVADPAVHALNQARYAGQVRESYPSKHTADAGVGLAILTPMEPHRATEFHWMADEVAYSRLVGGGHFMSDLTAGVELGAMIGDYERRRHGLD